MWAIADRAAIAGVGRFVLLVYQQYVVMLQQRAGFPAPPVPNSYDKLPDYIETRTNDKIYATA